MRSHGPARRNTRVPAAIRLARYKLLRGVKFYGFGTVPNGTSRQAFFTDGQEVYLVAEGEVFLQRFRILRIGNASVEFQEISSGRTATAPLEEQAGGSP